ncbi:MAG: hypothetical protein SFZ23_13385 [Planctomycetota bacterium]|nr:hypothetical protein [Planctomycetota bacterium]
MNIEEIAANNVAASKLVAAVNELAQKQKDAGGGVVGGDLVPSTDDRSVLIIAANEQVGLWKDLLARLDKREPVTTVTYTPRYFAPEEVGDLLEQIVRDAEDDRWKLVINQLLGSLVVTATSSQHQEIRAEIERLDSVTPSARRPVRSFIIKNRSVIEIREILEDLLETGVFDTDDEWRTSALAIGTSNGQPRGVPPDFESRGTVGAGGDAPAEGAVERRTEARGSVPSENTGPRAERSRSRDSGDRRNRLSASASSNSLFEHGEYEQAEDRRLVLSMDEGTNTLIAVGEPRILAQIDALLRSIDVRQPQVMLEVLLVTLSESQSFDLGVELERIRVSDDLQIRLSSLFGLGTRAGSSDRAAGDSAGFTAVVINPGDFSVILRALRTLNNGRSLTIPKLLVDNNERASLNSTLQQPFASVNAGNTVSTTSLGGTLDAGTVVSVQPQIAEGDHLMLNYSVSLSSFVGQSSSATLPPPRQQNSVQSSATIPDGFTVVVGGIEIETLSRAESKIPGLGDIPLLGEAFKSRNRNASRSKFFVFIRANVLRSPGFDDLKFISAQDVKRAGVDDGWPEVKPRVIR